MSYLYPHSASSQFKRLFTLRNLVPWALVASPIWLQAANADTPPSRPLVVTNFCSQTIYPGINTQAGKGPNDTGFKLETGVTHSQTVSEGWQGRVWGRTNCSFNANGTAPANNTPGKACLTGDCGGGVACSLAGEVPVTLAEFTMDAKDGQTYYDISLVDGYNLPMAIIMLPNSNSSLEKIPPNLTNPSCIATIGELADQNFNPYTSANGSFLGTNASFALPFENKTSHHEVSRWCPWDLQLTPPNKPGNGVYPYPDDKIERPEFCPCFSACAKFNEASDCCTGSHDSPGACGPSRYSKSAKKVCPDAYSYAFDDQTSTFIIPASAGFEVVFCPGGRSTNILATQKGKLNQAGPGNAYHRQVVFSQRRVSGWRSGFGLERR